MCQRDMVIVNVTVIDGTGREPQPGQTVEISNGRIVRIGASRGASHLDGETRVDGSGLTLIPGLIDCHVHITVSADADGEPELGNSIFAALRAARDAYRCLAAGITTLRDAGGREYVEMSLRRAIQQRILRGPRLLLAGKIVSMTTSGCLGYPGMYREADGPDEVRKAAREQLKMGADFVKVMATAAAFAPGEDPESVQYEIDELRAACDEAHKQNRTVAAHAEGMEGIRNAVCAGVDTIEHGDCLYQDEDVMQQMKDRGTILVPTLKVYDAAVAQSPNALPPGMRRNVRRMHEANARSFERAVEMQVPIAMGTDAGSLGNRHGENASELTLMVRHGMSPLQAIQASTQQAARALRLDRDLGTIQQGKVADLVLVAGDPSSEISVLEDTNRILMVLQQGEVTIDRRREAHRVGDPSSRPWSSEIGEHDGGRTGVVEARPSTDPLEQGK